MKKGLFILIAAVIIVMSIGSFVSCAAPESTPAPAPAPPAKATILKFASAATADYIPDEQAYIDTLNARLAPNYVIEYYPAGTMLAFPELLDGIRTGGAEMGAITPCFHSFDDPALGVSELPFLFNNMEAHRMGTKGLEPLYAGILEGKFNQKLLNLHNYMGMALISKKQVKVLEDFDGLLIQAISPVFADIIAAVGAAPVTGTPYTEAYSLLEKGTFDGTIQAPSSMVSYALFDVAKYMTSAYLVSAVHGFSINLDVWNKLSADAQGIIAEESANINGVIDQFVADKYGQDHADLLAEGVEIYYVPQDELDRWREVCKPIYDEKSQIYPEIFQKAMAIAAEANAKYPN